MANNIIQLIIKAQDLASSEIKKIERATGELNDSLEPVKNGMRVAGLAIAAAGVASVKMAADLEQGLNVFKSVSGATAEQMALVSAKARELGKDASLPGVSATHAAQAMTELAKAGLSVNDTLAASKGVLSLAKAGNMEVSDAALVAAQSLNAFKLSGDKAAFVADVLANGANASAADVHGLSLGLQQSAAVASQFGISLQDTVSALAIFANRGIQGSDAGTSLKTMLIHLANPSGEAAELMKKLGFSAFDANGKFVGLGLMAVRLQNSLQGLTQEQQNAALATMFGTDAFRAAAFLADSAGQKFEDMQGAIGKSGAAMDLAAAQNAGFNGALDNFISTMQTVGTEIGMKVLPPLTAFMRKLADSGVWDGIVNNIDLIVIALGALGAMITAIKIFAFVKSVMDAYKAFKLATGATTLFNAVLALNPILLIVLAVIALIAILVALEVRFKIISKALKWLGENGKAAWEWIKNAAGVVLDWLKAAWEKFFAYHMAQWNIIKGVLTAVGNFIKGVWDAIVNAARTAWNAIYNTVVKPVLDFIAGYIRVTFAVWEYIMQWIIALAKLAWNTIYDNVIKPVIDRIVGAWNWWSGVFKAVMTAIIGAATVAWNWIFANVISPVVDYIVGKINWWLGVFQAVMNAIGNAAQSAWNWVRNTVSGVWNWIVNTFNGLGGFFSGVWNSLVNALHGPANSIKSTFSSVGEAIKSGIKGAINWVIDRINGVIDSVNSIANKVPGAPKLGKIGRLASGTPNWPGGLTMVGERGPEVVALPQGSRVMSATQTRQALNGGGGKKEVNIQTVVLGTAEAAREFFKQLDNDTILGNKGFTPLRGDV